jgi:phospholipid/cholesterol/gamma-HCH transport system substrate-binding protein
MRTRIRIRNRLLVVPAVLALAAGLTSCSLGGGSSQHTASAVFNDIGNLANGAQVQLADVPVGAVTNIALDGSKAKVTLAFDTNARIPADVSASIARTTILGDQFVQLNVPKSEIGPGATTAPQLADGAVIKKTSTAADVEQLVRAGASVFGAISTTELEQIIQAGGQGFTGQAASLKAFLENLDAVTTTYSQHTADITSAVNGLDKLTSTLAPASGTTATALDNLSKTVQILAANSQQFENVLQSLDNLSTQGRSLLETYYPQIVTQLKTLQAVSSQVAQHQSDLAALLSAIPVANANLPNAVRNGYVQLYENIIVCGIPGLGSNNAQPAFSCAKTSGGAG